jgi:adenylate cyclase
VVVDQVLLAGSQAGDPMPNHEKLNSNIINDIWSTYLNTGEVPDSIQLPWYRHKRFRDLFHHLPDNPRCRICHSPFEGFGGAIMRHILGIVPSKLNPQLCNECETFAQRFKGGAEIEISILFADVRGSTHLAEQMNPTEFSGLINRFYKAATKVLFDSNAMVEKLIGDEVTGFFTAGISGPDHARLAVNAAREILRVTGYHSAAGPWIPLGIGVHTGLAYVGSVNADSGVADIAVLGDTPNLGARLAALAGPGEIYVSQATAKAAGLELTGADIRHQNVRGRSEPIDIWVLSS